MLSRGRPCLRRRLPAGSDTVATGSHEPLLFLYPRWVAPALRQRRPFSLTSIELPATTCRASRTPFRPVIPAGPSFARHSCRWISDIPKKTTDLTPKPPPHNVPGESPKENDGKTSDFDGSKRSGGNQLATKSEDDALQRQPEGHPAPKVDKGQGTCLVMNRPNSVDYSKLSPTARKRREYSIRDQQKIFRREYVKKHYRKQGKTYLDNGWIRTMKMLDQLLEKSKRTKTKKSPLKEKELLVSEETLATFVGVNQYTFQENIWFIAINNGCRVRVLPVERNKGFLRRILLSGTSRAIELTETTFSSAQSARDQSDPLAEYSKLAAPICSSQEALARSGLPKPLIQGSWYFQHEDGMKTMTLDQLTASRPEIKSWKDFVELVEDIVHARPPNSHEYSLNYSPKPKGAKKTNLMHGKRIKTALQRLFASEIHYHYLSSAALHMALEWLCQHEENALAQAICARHRHITTAETYNMLLKFAVKRQDLREFHSLLAQMGRHDINPNPQTWIILLSALVKPKEKAELIARMVQHNYLSDKAIIRDALHQTIQDSLLVHLDAGNDIDSFFELMARTYGADEASAALTGQIFEALARLRDHDSIDRLMQICVEKNLVIDGNALSSLMIINRSRIHKAIQYFLRFQGDPALPSPTSKNRETLFLQAYMARCYNVCRVLWRYACLRGEVTYKMKQTVLTSLCRNESKRANSELRTLWDLDAGKVMVGIDFHHETYHMPESILKELPPECRDNPLSFLNGWKGQGDGREIQLRLTNAIIHHDMGLASTYKPKHPLQIMLEAAYRIDQEWHDIPRPLNWKQQNAIQVPLIPKWERRTTPTALE